MRLKCHILSLLLVLWVGLSYSQEEESAAVFLEEYTDEFQENFFEALKQKGIENYDKAINLLLECKLLEENNAVVDHELAKVYLADKQFFRAQEYSIASLIAEPENLWYLNTLVDIVQKQGGSMESVKDKIPYDNAALLENLALIYYRKKNYKVALEILKSANNTSFTRELSAKIKDSLGKRKRVQEQSRPEATRTENKDPLKEYMAKIAVLIQEEDISKLKEHSSEALEHFPSHPYFYFTKGLALFKEGANGEAIKVLETGLDYLLDDSELANKMYRTLASAYTQQGNTSKANMYLSKIKSGL